MDASAFFVLGQDNEEVAVIVAQCRINDTEQRDHLIHRLQREVHEELGIPCLIELVPPHTLPRTSSGKLSRAAARADYLRRRDEEKKQISAFAEGQAGAEGYVPAMAVANG